MILLARYIYNISVSLAGNDNWYAEFWSKPYLVPENNSKPSIIKNIGFPNRISDIFGH
jgi:hypothetical protein